MYSFGKTRAAAQYAARHARAELTRVRATALLEQLTAWETATDGNDGRQAVADPGLLRSLVIAVRDLAGAGWLDAMADDPDVAAFAGLQASPSPLDPDGIDETCSRVLWARFSPVGAHDEGTR